MIPIAFLFSHIIVDRERNHISSSLFCNRQLLVACFSVRGHVVTGWAIIFADMQPFFSRETDQINAIYPKAASLDDHREVKPDGFLVGRCGSHFEPGHILDALTHAQWQFQDFRGHPRLFAKAAKPSGAG